MAPHDTNTRREARRHWFPLAGMAIVLALVMIGFLWWVARATGLVGEVEPVPEGGLELDEAIESSEPAADAPAPAPAPAAPPPQ